MEMFFVGNGENIRTFSQFGLDNDMIKVYASNFLKNSFFLETIYCLYNIREVLK